MSHEDEDYFLPLEDQRVFGAGIRRKRVPFVRSSEHELNTTAPASTQSSSSGSNIANKYLSIVLPKNEEETKAETETQSPHNPQDAINYVTPPAADSTHRCEVCNIPLLTEQHTDGTNPSTSSASRPHEASLAHQLCLTHSHPPSHLDRTSHGLRYLSSYGWDPDSRLGLGARGEGIREPLKGRLKADTAGLGAKVDTTTAARSKPAKVQKLNAKEVRKGHFEAKRRGEKMREMFYQNDDVKRYLGGG